MPFNFTDLLKKISKKRNLLFFFFFQLLILHSFAQESNSILQKTAEVPITSKAKYSLSPDGQFLAVTSPEEITVHHLEDEKLAPFQSIYLPDASFLQFTKDGNVLLIGDKQNNFHFYKKESQQYVHQSTFRAKGKKIGVSKLSDDGEVLVLSGSDKKLRIYKKDANRFQLFQTVGGLKNNFIYDLDISFDNNLILFSSYRTARLLELNKEGKYDLLKNNIRHSDAIHSVAFNKNGNEILTGDFKGGLTFSKFENGKLSKIVSKNTSEKLQKISLVNQQIVGTDKAGNLYLWKWLPHKEMIQLKQKENVHKSSFPLLFSDENQLLIPLNNSNLGLFKLEEPMESGNQMSLAIVQPLDIENNRITTSEKEVLLSFLILPTEGSNWKKEDFEVAIYINGKENKNELTFELSPTEIKCKTIVEINKSENNLDIVVNHFEEENVRQLEIVHLPPEISRKGKDYALLIAVKDYEGKTRPLNNPENDIDSLGAVLSNQYGFKVQKLNNPTVSEIKEALGTYTSNPPGELSYNEEDQLYIHFSGHGGHEAASKSLGYFIGKSNGQLNYGELENRIDVIECEHILVSIDACFSASFDMQLSRSVVKKKTDLLSTEDLKEIKDKWQVQTRRVITSASERAADGQAGQCSPFVDTLLDVFEQNKAYITFDELSDTVDSAPSLKSSQPKQGVFGRQSNHNSDFFFIRKR